MPASVTPILDREVPPPPLRSERKSKLIGAAIGVVAGIALVTLPILNPSVPTGFSPGLGLLLFIAFWQITIALHEGAHVLAGRLVGFASRGMMICSYRIVQTVSGWRFSFEWRRFIAGGFAYVMPSRPEMEDWRYGVMIAAGPISNSVLLVLELVAPFPAWAEPARVPAIIATGVITLCSLVPLSSGGAVSDMSRLVSLARGNDDWQRLKLILRYQTLNFLGYSPREWDAGELNAAAALDGGRPPDRLGANLLAYYAAIDRREIDEAAGYLETTLTLAGRLGSTVRRVLFYEAAFFQARRRNQPAIARAWLAEAGPPKGLPKYCGKSAEAAILLAEGKSAEAAQTVSTALAGIGRHAIRAATTQMGVDALQEIMQEATASQRATAGV